MGFLGDEVEFDYEWISVYTFQCRRMERFVHDRVIFAGDSAHLVSPFGARGCNGGFADVDNLVWKLDLVLRGAAPASLLESYNEEATTTADENILNSTRSTDFLTPKSNTSRQFRDAVLSMSRKYAFARPLVNSGRLSTPVSYPTSVLNTADTDGFSGGPAAGDPCVDAPLRDRGNDLWLLSQLGGRFVVLMFDADEDESTVKGWANDSGIDVVQVHSDAASGLADVTGLARERYDAKPGTTYLVRPDQYVAGRWRRPRPDVIDSAWRNACGRNA